MRRRTDARFKRCVAVTTLFLATLSVAVCSAHAGIDVSDCPYRVEEFDRYDAAQDRATKVLADETAPSIFVTISGDRIYVQSNIMGTTLHRKDLGDNDPRTASERCSTRVQKRL